MIIIGEELQNGIENAYILSDSETLLLQCMIQYTDKRTGMDHLIDIILVIKYGFCM